MQKQTNKQTNKQNKWGLNLFSKWIIDQYQVDCLQIVRSVKVNWSELNLSVTATRGQSLLAIVERWPLQVDGCS